MSLNATPSSERLHIGIFGRRNAGKSSIINALTGQSLAIVSEVKGTTTDPVLKAMELLPLGPVVIIDTAGIDDNGELGELRIKKAYQMLNKTDIAMLIIDAVEGMTDEDNKILAKIQDKKIPYIIVINKSDLAQNKPQNIPQPNINVSAKTNQNIHELKELIAKQIPQEKPDFPLVRDLVEEGDFVVLVIPIDKAAPKGRLILPQQQTIRDLLEAGATSIVVRDTELAQTLADLGKKPKLVITDSQAFATVSKDTPEDILLTSFSILFARYKGELDTQVKATAVIDQLQDGDRILISEGCTHHRQCDDIGTVKLPNLIKKYTRKDVQFDFTSGGEFPLDLSSYKLAIHCGGCMLNEREMKYRIKCSIDAGLPITNYGTALAHLNGILNRSLECFGYKRTSLKNKTCN